MHEPLMRAHKPTHEQGFQILARIANDMDIGRIAANLTGDAIHAGDDLPVLRQTDIRQFLGNAAAIWKGTNGGNRPLDLGVARLPRRRTETRCDVTLQCPRIVFRRAKKYDRKRH
ncbi:hypothetical protein [Burkholderia latens]|uniref:hypothetical protein n=1 Tax=Burkholderia latens TaxID=488446 RepID=UPI00158AD185|nr:hypothetical protein [Burkholderia latens]